jgi:hypothetical protein
MHSGLLEDQMNGKAKVSLNDEDLRELVALFFESNG